MFKINFLDSYSPVKQFCIYCNVVYPNLESHLGIRRLAKDMATRDGRARVLSEAVIMCHDLEVRATLRDVLDVQTHIPAWPTMIYMATARDRYTAPREAAMYHYRYVDCDVLRAGLMAVARMITS